MEYLLIIGGVVLVAAIALVITSQTAHVQDSIIGGEIGRIQGMVTNLGSGITTLTFSLFSGEGLSIDGYEASWGPEPKFTMQIENTTGSDIEIKSISAKAGHLNTFILLPSKFVSAGGNFSIGAIFQGQYVDETAFRIVYASEGQGDKEVIFSIAGELTA